MRGIVMYSAFPVFGLAGVALGHGLRSHVQALGFERVLLWDSPTVLSPPL